MEIEKDTSNLQGLSPEQIEVERLLFETRFPAPDHIHWDPDQADYECDPMHTRVFDQWATYSGWWNAWLERAKVGYQVSSRGMV